MIDTKEKKESALGFNALFEDDDNDASLDLTDFKISPKSKSDAPSPEEIKALAGEEGFVDRAGDQSPPKRKKAKPPARPAGAMRRSRYYETGRNVQFNKKVEQADRDRFNEICDRQEWVGGQAMKYLLDAIEEKLAHPDDPFWQSRNYTGVD